MDLPIPTEEELARVERLAERLDQMASALERIAAALERIRSGFIDPAQVEAQRLRLDASATSLQDSINNAAKP